MIKCIVCDMDGTLIRYDDRIEEKTYQLLRKCIEEGIEFIIATGRDINMMVDVLNRYDLKGDMILNNGAQYYLKNGETKELYPMDNQEFLRIIHILNDYHYLLAIHTDHGKYSLVNADDFWTYHMKLLNNSALAKGHPLPQKTFTMRECYLRDFHYVEKPEDIVEQGIGVLKIDARLDSDYSVKGVKEQLNSDYLDISSSFEDNIEITSHQSHKGKMLKRILEEKGYLPEEVAIFGDGQNDCTMLQLTPYSFAPSNASQHAKDVAKYHLTKTNDDGAVGEGLEILQEMGLIEKLL